MSMRFPLKNSVVRVVDSDTCDVRLDLGFRIFTIQRIRLARIDGPEMGTQEGVKAKEFVEHFFAQYGPTVDVETQKPDKYGRVVGEIRIVHGPVVVNLSDELLNAGLVKPYVEKP